jgi:hypothetical protein
MDETLFERLLATLRRSLSVGLSVLKPEAIAGELARRWNAYAEVSALRRAGEIIIRRRPLVRSGACCRVTETRWV